MNIKEIDAKKKPVVIDKSLDFFNDKVLFPDKLEKAYKMLKETGLPKNKKGTQQVTLASGLKQFLNFQKNKFNIFQSTSEPLEIGMKTDSIAKNAEKINLSIWSRLFFPDEAKNVGLS